jgi:anti-sigma regulatory factor (Ser/Thr protein kinase)
MTVCVSRRFDLEATADAPANARHFVRDQLVTILEDVPGLPELRADVELLVSELVSNAVKASPAPVTLGMDVHHHWLGLTVHDGAPEEPVMLDPDPADTHGRGLRIVTVLADAWGVEGDPAGGKTVWVRVPLPAAAAATLTCERPADLEWAGR